MSRSTLVRSYILLLLASMLGACQPAYDWVDQYPLGFKPKLEHKLVYTYNRDSVFVTGRTILEIPGIYANEDGEVWVVEGSGNVLYAPDGEHFAKIKGSESPQLNCISGTGNQVWIGGIEGTMLHCTPEKCEREKLPGKPQDIWGLKIAANGIDGWAWSNNGTLYRRTDDGWQLLDSLYKYYMHNIWCNRTCNNVWLACDSGILLHLEPDNKWKVALQLKQKWPLYTISMSENGAHGLVYADFRRLLEYRQGRWATMEDTTIHIRDAYFSDDGGEGWSVGENYQLYRYSGNSWNALPVVTKVPSTQNVIFNNRECWIVDMDGVFHSSDNKYFSKVNFGERSSVFNSMAANSSNIWIGGWDYNVLKLERNPKLLYPALAAIKFQVHPNGDSVNMQFKFVTKMQDMRQNLPDSIWLNAVVRDDTIHPRFVPARFSISEQGARSCVCTATFPVDSLVTGFYAPEYRYSARLALSCIFKGANEVVTFDLKEHNKNELHLRR